MRTDEFFQKIIEYSFYLLFFVTPFILTTNNFELFEFPKMLFVYGLTIIITGSFLALSLLKGRLEIKLSFYIFSLAFFLISQIISTLISIDRHTSFWGYYSRFHGGLASTFCYFLLSIIFLSSINKRQVKNSLFILLSAASFISLYAIAEHFGIDAQYWVQDVQNRVYSTLGQPNWLASWLAALIPLSLAFFLKPPRTSWPLALFLAQLTTLTAYGLTFLLTGQILPISAGPLLIFLIFFGIGLYLSFRFSQPLYQIASWTNLFSLLGIISILVLALLFTKSRSGILALVLSYGFFWLLVFLASQNPKRLIKKWLGLTSLLLILFLLVGTEWTPNLGQITKGDWRKLKAVQVPVSPNRPPKYHISKSTDIRKAVWEGGLNVYYHAPLFGSGVETFAYSYYNHRARLHNDTSEWDFLYNKAHNEYLNFLATTGLVGTTALFGFIFSFFLFSLRKLIKKKPLSFVCLTLPFSLLLVPRVLDKLIIYPALLPPLALAAGLGLLISLVAAFLRKPHFPQLTFLQIALLSGFLGMIITNYYGFSVVVVALLFFLYPAFSSVLYEKGKSFYQFGFAKVPTWLGLAVILLAVSYLLLATINYWRADKIYTQSKRLIESGSVLNGINQLQQAINLRPREALYHMELAEALSLVAFSYHTQQATEAAQLTNQSLSLAEHQTETALSLNQVHLNLYKTATKVYIILAQIDPRFFAKAVAALEKAAQLSPTDPKITLNLGLLAQQSDNKTTAQAYFEQTVQLKPNYRQGWIALANFWKQEGEIEKAKQAYQYILDKINPEDEEAKYGLEQGVK